MKNRVLFLDRDGTVVVQKDGSYLANVEEVSFKNDNIEFILNLNDEKLPVIIVTNQAGINKGITTWEQVNLINEHIRTYLENKGMKILDIYVCPHRIEESCQCRKPQPGLLLKASKEHDINLAESIIVGDQDMDIEAGKNAGLKKVIKI
mgnify:CR=1 FL=1|jgi:D-glycero-D-manno-heptose 1,7-bisphosphate phosphatase